MEKENDFQLLTLTVLEVIPALIKEERVLAYKFNAQMPNGETVSLYENKALDLKEYVNKKIDCLVEITKGEFKYIDKKKEQIPSDVLRCKYKWVKRLYEYFPELVKLASEANNASEKEEEKKRELFEESANQFFKSWGMNGLQFGVLQSMPLLSSPYGLLLLNEYEFEENLEEFEFEEDVYIKIDELFLRGVAPHILNETEQIKTQKIYEVYNGVSYTKEEWKEYCIKNGSRLNLLD
jgi:hypothetical protein